MTMKLGALLRKVESLKSALQQSDLSRSERKAFNDALRDLISMNKLGDMMLDRPLCAYDGCKNPLQRRTGMLETCCPLHRPTLCECCKQFFVLGDYFPDKGRELLPTGVFGGYQAERTLLVDVDQYRCPACQTIHKWGGEEARFINRHGEEWEELVARYAAETGLPVEGRVFRLTDTTPIDTLLLSDRVEKCLHAAEVHTVGELRATRLERIRGIGALALKELREVLAQ